jgi:hypothetical protein
MIPPLTVVRRIEVGNGNGVWDLESEGIRVRSITLHSELSGRPQELPWQVEWQRG